MVRSLANFRNNAQFLQQAKNNNYPPSMNAYSQFGQQHSHSILRGLSDRELLERLIIHVKGCPNFSDHFIGMANNESDIFGSIFDIENLKNTNFNRKFDFGPLISIVDEICRRRAKISNLTGRIISDWKALRDYIQISMRDKSREYFCILILDSKLKLIDDILVSEGVVNAVYVHPRKIIELLLSRNSTNFFMVHNHPSGISTPTLEDLDFTENVDKLCAMLGINLLDHLIVGNGEIYSFRDHASL